MALGLVLAFAAPGFFARDNLSDLFLANLPVLIVALGMTLIILTGEIDISVGSVFAIAGVAAGLLAKAGLPMPLVAVSACLVGAALGGLNGALVAYVRIPSIVVSLATMVALARRPALGDRRRLDSGSAARLPVARPDPGRLSVRRARHGRRAHRSPRVGARAISRPAARSMRPARTAKRRAWPGFTPPSSPSRYSRWRAA